MSQNTVNIRTIITWTVGYLFVCGLVPVIIDKIIPRFAKSGIYAWLNLISLIVLNYLYIFLLVTKYGLNINLFGNISLIGILLAVGCSVLFYLMIDKFLDPFFDRIFTASAKTYRNAVEQLGQFPVINFIRVCILAPAVEEIFIRGCILESLQKNYSAIIALLISSLLFALLHFNFVQTMSALISGLILGILYIYTGSLFSCILAHAMYNAFSYFSIILSKK